MELPKLQKIETKNKVGLVVVITGYGKGKTTTALGLALRALGHGFRVCIIQFMKGDLYTGEMDGLKRLEPDIELIRTGKGFCGIQGNPYPYEEHRANAQEAITLAKEKITSGKYELVILDEINNALHLKLVDLDQVIELIESKPDLVHLVLTGRDAHPEVIKRAHTVTEMIEVKHAYKLGIEPQAGIDY
ncbi:MAG: cob(I)yrinic acid a,c-diamide adenosyltransferase [Proteobacteria bacterium]|nr:cob(I)yrinic acid a,c-diamide adenosyltransferase [Pseudomonadota bacterium]